MNRANASNSNAATKVLCNMLRRRRSLNLLRLLLALLLVKLLHPPNLLMMA